MSGVTTAVTVDLDTGLDVGPTVGVAIGVGVGVDVGDEVAVAVALSIGCCVGVALETPFVTHETTLGLSEPSWLVVEVDARDVGLGVTPTITGELAGIDTGAPLLLSGTASVACCPMSTSFPTLVAPRSPIEKKKYQRAKAASARITRTIQTQVRANTRADLSKRLLTNLLHNTVHTSNIYITTNLSYYIFCLNKTH